jgi:uncharacterized protein YegP (UPF0339 family)
MRMLGYFKEGTDVVTSYSFEIVRRPNDRLSWRFVEFRDDRRRVLAHADRDYRDKERAEKAICVIKKEASEADVFDATGATDDFDLPMRSFEITPYVVPLLIGQPQARHTRANGHRRRSRRRPTPTDRPVHPAAEETAPAEVPSAAPVGRDFGEDAGAAKKAASAAAKKAAPAASVTKATRGGAAKKASGGRSAARGSGTR